MEKLIVIDGAAPPVGHGEPLGWPDESWDEFADACLTHDDRCPLTAKKLAS